MNKMNLLTSKFIIIFKIIIFFSFFQLSYAIDNTNCTKLKISPDLNLDRLDTLTSTRNQYTISSDGKYYLKSGSEGSETKVALKDLKTNEPINISDSDINASSAQISSDSKYLIASSPEGVFIKNFITNKSNRFKLENLNMQNISSANISVDGKNAVITNESGPVIIKNLESMKDIRIPTNLKHIAFSRLSPDGKNLILTDFGNNVQIQNLETGKSTDFRTQYKWDKDAQISADGKSLYLFSKNFRNDSAGIITKINLETKQETPLSDHGLGISPDGKSIAILKIDGLEEKSNLNSVEIKNLETNDSILVRHKGRTAHIQFSPDGKSITSRDDEGILKLTSLDLKCINDLVIPTKLDANGCPETENLKDEGVLSSLKNGLTKLTLSGLCKLPFNKMAWDQITPRSSQINELSTDDIHKFLMRFQKPGGFNEEDLPIMISLLKNRYAEKEPELLLGALQGIFYTSPSLYNQLQKLNPELEKIKTQDSTKQSCRTEAESLKINQKITDRLTQLEKSFSNTLNFNDIEEQLSPMSPLLKNLPTAQKEKWLERLSEQLTDNAKLKDPLLSEVFQSKTYKFINQAIKPLFGMKPLALTDLTSQVNKETIKTNILTSSPTATSNKNNFGFYSSELPAIKSQDQKKASTKKVSWKMGEKTYAATIDIKPSENKKIIPEDKGPDYQSLWKDNTLTGVVFAGSNLEEKTTKTTMHQYLAYYQAQGFDFESTPGIMNDFPKFLQEETESGQMDYLIKEAHSDGDDKNVFRTNKKVRYEIGIKELPDGKKEKIYLVYPDLNDKQTTLVSNIDFGSWIQKREKSGGGQFVYMNTSCWSKSKAKNEIQAAQSPLLLNIATTTTSDTFSNKENGAEYQLLQNFREKKDFAEIRTGLLKNERYQSGEGNVFIFPDEEKYKETITKEVMGAPQVTISTTLDGRPYNIDQDGH